MSFVLPGSPRPDPYQKKSHQSSAGLASEPVRDPVTSFTKRLDKTPLTVIMIEVKDFKQLRCATRRDLCFQTTKVFLNVIRWHIRWTPQQQKALCVQLVCLAAAPNLRVRGWTIELARRIAKTISCCKGAPAHLCKTTCKSWARVFTFSGSKAWHSPCL